MVKIYGDCRSITISKMLNYIDIDFTPAMCFGLGQGYDFRYWIEKDSKVPMIVTLGRNLDSEENLLNELGLTVKKLGNIEKSTDENMAELDSILKQKENVFLNVDRFYLDYLKEKLNPYHFGNHSILVKGVTNIENQKKYMVYDALIDDVRYVSDYEIKLGRESKYKPCSPDYYGFYIEGNKSCNKIGFNEIKDSINRNLNRYLYKKGNGIDAFNKFIRELTGLEESLISNDEIKLYLKLQMNFISRYILEFENTNSFYRKVYSEFLKEVDKKYKLNSFHRNIKEFSLLGDDWNRLGSKIANKSTEDINKALIDIKTDLKILCKNEQTAAENLLNSINSY